MYVFLLIDVGYFCRYEYRYVHVDVDIHIDMDIGIDIGGETPHVRFFSHRCRLFYICSLFLPI